MPFNNQKNNERNIDGKYSPFPKMAFPSAVKSHRQDVDNNDVALCVYVTVLICFLFISFFFLAERRGRCIDRNGGLRQ
jgi:hypothetical protein